MNKSSSDWKIQRVLTTQNDKNMKIGKDLLRSTVTELSKILTRITDILILFAKQCLVSLENHTAAEWK